MILSRNDPHHAVEIGLNWIDLAYLETENWNTSRDAASLSCVSKNLQRLNSDFLKTRFERRRPEPPVCALLRNRQRRAGLRLRTRSASVFVSASIVPVWISALRETRQTG
jgi:hypothetical protein